MIGTGLGLGLAGFRINPAGGPVPVLDINFRDYKTFSSAIGPTASFSRASTGTYFDETGVMRTAAVNTGRINHVYNGTSWVCKGGLIEEQRTNLLTNSEDFNHASWDQVSGRTIFTDAASAPDGNTTADRIQLTSGGYFYSRKAYSTTGNHTFSIYLRANSNTTAFIRLSNDAGTQQATLSCSVTTVWQRFSVTVNWTSNPSYWYAGIDQRSAVGGPGASCDVFAWGAQLEAGAFATSYIPTTSAAVTRSADVMQITGSDFSGFWNGTEGSFAVEYDRIGYASGAYPPINYAYKTSSPGGDVIAWTGNNNAGGGESFWVAATSFQAQIVAGSMLAAGVAGKIAACYKVNDFAATLNGAAAVTDNSGSLPTVDAMAIGRNGDGSAYGNCHIARLRYWNTRLDNGTLRVLST